ncbi:MarR family winged helix-turn-helix transcriptional regulator [Pseudohongiella spirulinae]|uniref:MarR family transcriptional regulator n=1 Tax=Pseudohongiella spirulinae TaxID=1249552 RepID=A0A0S2KBR5_9GAMM|nr:MarR family transcriptional regulator [Pseudohongiella spirulinae]ALO45761.1 MarR family transcriptional regulator [Pseudohongiella spirulinae]
MKKSATPESDNGQLMFDVLNEIGIIAQLSRALLESRLGDGLTQHHFSALNHLVRLGDGRTPLQMARAFQVPKTSMSHTLAGLEKRGLIRMEPNPQDGRGKLIYLTDAGRTLRDTAVRMITPDIMALIPQFGTEDAKAVLPVLRKLRVLLDEARD